MDLLKHSVSSSLRVNNAAGEPATRSNRVSPMHGARNRGIWRKQQRSVSPMHTNLSSPSLATASAPSSPLPEATAAPSAATTATATPTTGAETTATATATATPSAPAPGDDILFINNSSSFELRALFQRNNTAPSVHSSTLSMGGRGHGQVSHGGGGHNLGQQRLRAREELCLVMRKSQSGPRSASKRKAWFMTAGLIGRDPGEHVTIVTKEPSMAAVHAELSLDGDDYLIRDRSATTTTTTTAGGTCGSFLCLATTSRHHPQRDGFRLRAGDTFHVGSSATITVHELLMTTEMATTTPHASDDTLEVIAEQFSSTCTPDDDESDRIQDTTTATATATAIVDRLPKRVRFADVHDKTGKGPLFNPVLPADDGSEYPVGVRYSRLEKLSWPVYQPHVPRGLKLTVRTEGDAGTNTTTELILGPPKKLQLPHAHARPQPQQQPQSTNPAHPSTHPHQAPSPLTYTIGSSPWCDIHVPCEDVHGVHARIVFDGHFFVLQDLSFESRATRQTRVELTRATRLARGDCILLGECVFTVVTVSRAFRHHDCDLKLVAFKCHLLRPSKRKTRRRDKYFPIGFRHATGTSFAIGKGSFCDGPVYTTSLCVEQFLLQLENGTCNLTPRYAGLSQGMYFLLGRDSLPHEVSYKPDVVRTTSKALMLVEGSVFRVGSAEVEVTMTKVEHPDDIKVRHDEIRDNLAFLQHLPWLQQIVYDHHGLESMAIHARRVVLDAGECIYEEGDTANTVFIVLSGEVALLAPSHARGAMNDLAILTTPRDEMPHSSAVEEGSDPASEKEGPDTAESKADNQATTPDDAVLEEHVGIGSYFGETALIGSNREYTETASSATTCHLLLLSQEALGVYLAPYMDIIRPHLRYEYHKDVLHKLRLCVPWCATLSYDELRALAAHVECISFHANDVVVRDSALHDGEAPHAIRRHGLLLLRHGVVEIEPTEQEVSTDSAATSAPHGSDAVDASEAQRSHRCISEQTDAGASAIRGELTGAAGMNREGLGSKEANEQLDTWALKEPLLLAPPEHKSANTALLGPVWQSCSPILRARTNVQCFFLNWAYIEPLASLAASSQDESPPIDTTTKHPGHENGDVPPEQLAVEPARKAAVLTPRMAMQRQSTYRKNSMSIFKVRHSQVITTGLHDTGPSNDGDTHIDNADLEDQTDSSRKWRRKKRNKALLEKTIQETQANEGIPNALVLYVLSGANRGDIHVVQHSARIGCNGSGADIELNDAYVANDQAVITLRDCNYWLYDDGSAWGTYVRLEESQPVQIFPGDVFLAGEVEFTCMGVFPDRKKTSLCCIQ